ncbi:hypothetical protein POJ06DRAFT_228601 [Lipomyces tetrasporus]|uniref:Tachykinin family protein n=1 Tax=Lipomyces tetrasporus TaxID=54092 RepID=A0AAD7QLN7_9ASCO|nr:uncharacterized protein POJ06DRAFT_228601 [Lipomyces tetrasporus]KAJ8097215.1 hypothetical protein POJ06DRAFT_228601 [Lipomyces tetrasporus]
MAGPDESRGSSGSPARMPFIISSNVEKADPATRKLIRSHVMRGKKQKRGRPDNGQRTTSWGTMAGRTQAARVKLEEVMEMYTPLVPGRVGSDLSFIEFADEIEPSMLLNALKVSTVATRVIFPLITGIGFQVDNKGLYLIGPDAAGLHITAFAMEGFIDRILRHQENSINPAAMLHFQKGLRLLRERLSGEDDETKISDSTIGVVLKLASAAHFNGDYQTSKQHMEGIRKMVDLRGGLDVFKGKHLLVEMLRCDLEIALLNGSNHVFFCQPSEPVMEYPEKLLPASDDTMCSQDNIELIRNMDNNLATAWRVMRRFCLLVNLGTQTQRLIRLEIIHETMTAVIYRLLHMGFAASSIDETVRHGLLAFSHHVFLQWQDIKLPYHHLPTAYRNCILHLKLVDGVSSQLMLWLLMTGANSVFNISDEVWLREYLREHADRCQVKTWKEMQDILKSFMWIELLDEQPGKHIYGLLNLDKGRR